MSPNGYYKHDHVADKLLTTCFKNIFVPQNFIHRYISSQSNQNQMFDHDSGSSWFKESENYSIESPIYSLMAISSRATPPPITAGNPYDSNQVIKEFDTQYGEDSLSLKMLKLENEIPFEDILTPLSPHRDWIYRQCL